MYKKLFVMSLILVVVLFIFSCSSSNDNNEVDASYLVGAWVHTPNAYPDLSVWRFHDDGTYSRFSSFSENNEYQSGTYVVENNTLTYILDRGETNTANLKKIDENQMQFSITTNVLFFYKKEAVSFGPISEIALTVNNMVWTENDLTLTDEHKWFYFNAVSGNDYFIGCDDNYFGSGSYTGDVTVTAYSENLSNKYFNNNIIYGLPQVLTANATERIYLLVRPIDFGSFAIRVTN